MPLRSVRPVLRTPTPLTRTRTPGTGFPSAVTLTRSVSGSPSAVRIFGETAMVGQAAGVASDARAVAEVDAPTRAREAAAPSTAARCLPPPTFVEYLPSPEHRRPAEMGRLELEIRGATVSPFRGSNNRSDEGESLAVRLDRMPREGYSREEGVGCEPGGVRPDGSLTPSSPPDPRVERRLPGRASTTHPRYPVSGGRKTPTTPTRFAPQTFRSRQRGVFCDGLYYPSEGRQSLVRGWKCSATAGFAPPMRGSPSAREGELRSLSRLCATLGSRCES
jgi:hypothetical protein